jgi:hypothetical protein
MPEQIHQSTPVARKRHECDVCRTAIEPGTHYVRSLNKMDDIYTFVEHEDCRNVGSATLDGWYNGYEGYHAESVEEWLTEHRDHLTEEQRTVLERIENGRRERLEAVNVTA